MLDTPVNAALVMAIFVAGIVRFVIGGIWYSKWCFQKTWMKLSGVKESDMKKDPLRPMLVELLAGFFMAYVLALVVRHTAARNVVGGMEIGFLVWVGFVATVTIGAVVFEKKSFRWFALLNGFQLVSMLAMGAILAIWPQ